MGLGARAKKALQTLVGGVTPNDQQLPPKQYGTVKKLSGDKSTELIGDLDTKIKAGISAYADRKNKMMVADKYWLGEHWDDNAPPWMPKPVENWVFATVEQHSANLATANIVPIIYGQDPGDDDIANMFDLVVQYLWGTNKLNGRRIVRRSIHTALKLGTALVKVYWDNNVNGGRTLPRVQDFTNPLNGESYPVSHTLYKGEVCYELVDPSNVIPDPSGYALEGPGACNWITIRTPRNLNWIQNNQMFQQYVGKSQLKTKLEQLEIADKGATEFYFGRTVNNTHSGSKEVMLDEVWMRQMDEFGNWHINLVYKVGDILLYYAEDVYKDGQFPFSVLYDYEVDKSFFGMGEPEQVIANQNTINQISRLIALNAMHMTNTQKVVTYDSGINPDKVAELGSMPGAVWPSRTPDGIKNLDVPEIPASSFKTVSEAREGIRMIMAMDEANMGQFGGSVTAASGIKMIQDKANVRDQDKGFNVEDFVSRLVYLTISRIQQFYTEERYIPIVGEDGSRQFFPFTGSDYEDICLTVHVEAGSGTPINKSSIGQRAWDMFQKQAEQKFDPPLITAEELLDTFDGFPLKERIKKRIKEANAGKQVQQAMQLAQVLMMLQQQGIDLSQLDPQKLVAMSQQMQAPTGPAQAVPGQNPPVEGNPVPPQG
jgi:hypothetical protein